MSPPLFLGVDGGGSRCRARLETEDGAILGQGLAGPASMRFGFETARDAILSATQQCLDQASLGQDVLSRIYAGIGLAGTGQRGAREALEAWRHPFARAWFEGDGYTALLGAFSGGEGGVVIAGTGSIGITFEAHTIRVGGYGFPVSDEGSGADLGLNALRFALRTLDGRADPSPFSQTVLAVFHNDPSTVIDWMETASATDYAKLAPIVIDHAQNRDAEAQRLMRKAGADIADLVETMFKRGAPRVALSGGLAPHLVAYMPAATTARLSQPEGDAMAGAILLAKQRRAAALAASQT